MKTKTLHNPFSKSSAIIAITLFVQFASAITNLMRAQDTFTWTGASSNDWATAGNWTKTGSAGADTYPGQSRTVDYVVISNGGSPVLANTLRIGKLTVSNTTGASTGSKLTINASYTLTVSALGTTASPAVQLQGGNIVNNGILNITATATGSGYGIICTTPSAAPGSATTYSYSGSGTLSINTSAGNGSSVYFNGTNANSTYKISFPSSTTLTLKANTTALNVAANTTSPVIISGTGFTLGSSGSPVQAGILLQNGNGTNVTVDAGTTLTSYMATSNTGRGVYMYCTIGGGSFTNNGNIYGYGNSTKDFINLTNQNTSGTNSISFINNGIIVTNMVQDGTYAGILNIPTVSTGLGTNTITITNSGTLTLKNTSVTANAGYALYCGNNTPSSGSLTTSVNNTGTFELSGIMTSTGGIAGKVTFNNNSGGIVNMLNLGLDKVVFNNNNGATLDCKTNSITSGSTYPVSINAGSTLKTANTGGLLCIAGTLPNGAVLDLAANYVFNGAAAQTLNSAGTSGAALTANNIEINNSFGLTFNNATTVNGTLTISSGTLNLGSYTPTAGALVLGTSGQNNGTYGGTSSSATYKSSYFNSSATGVLTASNDSRNLTWNGTVSNVWSLTGNWDLGVVPTAWTNSITIPSSLTTYPTISGTATLKSITINPNAQLTNTASGLTVSTLNIQSDATGTGTFVDKGTSTSIATANVNQYLGLSSASAPRSWYICSPVNGAQAVVPTAQTFYGYQEDGTNTGTGTAETAYWKAYAAGTQFPTLAKGYVVQPATATTLTFTGTLNTGDISSPNLSWRGAATYKGFNLIGNPYPSYLNVLPSIANNANLDQTVWYRTQGTEATPLYHFETVNVSSGVGTNAAGTGQVTGYIPPMQAFWVHTNADAQTISLLNTNRSHACNVTLNDGPPNSVVPTTLLKSPSSRNTQQAALLRLNVSNGVSGDETVIYTNANAANGYDNYDSQKMSNNNAAIPEIATMVDGHTLTINGYNTLPVNTELALSFTTGQANTFSIKASQLSNLDPGTQVILKDNLLGTQTDLTDGSAYSFSSGITNTSTRFSVLFKSAAVTTGLEPSIENSVSVYRNEQKQIVVNYTGNVSSAEVSVYNVTGQKMHSNKLTSNLNVLNTPLNSGVYLVTVRSSGKTQTKKVIID